MVGGTRGVFPDASSVADLEQALSAIPEQVAAGYKSICVKPSQFIDDRAGIGAFCREMVARVTALVG